MIFFAILVIIGWFSIHNVSANSEPGSIPTSYDCLNEYAHIASVAYCLNKGLKEGRLGDEETGCQMQLCEEAPYKNIEIIQTFNFNDLGEVGSGYYGLDHKKKRILLVFRGTASTRDWIGNIDTFPVNYEPVMKKDAVIEEDIDCEGCRVHRGFYTFLKNNCARLMEEVMQLKQENENYRIVVVGHSLGAALTILTGIEFQLMGYNPLVVSYAGPKVGNSEMMDFVDRIFSTDSVTERLEQEDVFDCGYIRVVHEGDLVPRLPPTGSFVHGGVEFIIDKKELPHEPEDVKLVEMDAAAQEQLQLESARLATISPGVLWPRSLGKYEHQNYFLHITGCVDAND